MKKRLAALALFLCLLPVIVFSASASAESREAAITYREIFIVVDGVQQAPKDASGQDVEPFIMDGSTYLPVRAVADALGLAVDWDGETSTVTLTSGGRRADEGLPRRSSSVQNVTITYRDIKLCVDGEVITPKDAAGQVVEPFIMDGSTYLPVRAVADALGLEVSWVAATSTVHLTTPGGVEPDPNAKWRLAESSEVAYGGMSGKNTVYEYDDAGVLRSCVTTYLDPYQLGQVYSTSTFSVDSENRVLRRDDSLGNSWTYQYNSAGQTTYQRVYTAGSDSALVTTWEYDAAGRCVRETVTYDNGDKIITSMTYGPSGLWDTFERLIDYTDVADARLYGNCEYKFEIPGETRPTMMTAHLFSGDEHVDIEVYICYEENGYSYSVSQVLDGEVLGTSWVPNAVYFDDYGNVIQKLTASGAENYKYERID